MNLSVLSISFWIIILFVVCICLLRWLVKKIKKREKKYISRENTQADRGNKKAEVKRIYTNADITKNSTPSVAANIRTTSLSQTHKVESPLEDLERVGKIIEKRKPNVPVSSGPQKEEQNQVKYIGYTPINVFAQTEPLSYPYVIMPKQKSVIKFPRKGRKGRKGFKEQDFKEYIEKYFRRDFQVFDDRFILIKNASSPYEPDFTIIDERGGINLFLDIEIDEPYEGINDIQSRKVTHYQQADIRRNEAFRSRGWVIIRFAEIQIHQQPDSCCRFIADVIKSVCPGYHIPVELGRYYHVLSIPQWTKEEAEKWSIEKYREKYLGINQFGLVEKDVWTNGIEETELGAEIEKLVKEEPFVIQPDTRLVDTKFEIIHSTIHSGKYLLCMIGERKTIVRPIQVTPKTLKGFCYVSNADKLFSLNEIDNIRIKDNYYTSRLAGSSIEMAQLTTIIHMAINNQKFIRMKYTRSGWSTQMVDRETGEVFNNTITSEESVRTISNIKLSISVLPESHINAYRLNKDYITAYCHRREEERTFKFNRIGWIEILNL